MGGGAGDDLGFIRRENAVLKFEADAGEFSQPKFDLQEVVIARGAFVTEPAFGDGKNCAGFLQFQERFTQMPKEFTAGFFEEVEIPPIIDMVADSAFGVGDAVLVLKGEGWFQSSGLKVLHCPALHGASQAQEVKVQCSGFKKQVAYWGGEGMLVPVWAGRS